MDRWEYLKLACDFENGFWRVRKINGAELPNWKHGPPDTEYANQLGADGWELATSYPADGQYTHSFAFWFKRRRP